MQFTANLLEDGRVLVGGEWEGQEREEWNYESLRKPILMKALKFLTEETEWTVKEIHDVQLNPTPYALQLFVECELEGVVKYKTASENKIAAVKKMGYDIHFLHQGKDIFISSSSLTDDKIMKIEGLGYKVFKDESNNVYVCNPAHVNRMQSGGYLYVSDFDGSTVVATNAKKIHFQMENTYRRQRNFVLLKDDMLFDGVDYRFSFFSFNEVTVNKDVSLEFYRCNIQSLRVGPDAKLGIDVGNRVVNTSFSGVENLGDIFKNTPPFKTTRLRVNGKEITENMIYKLFSEDVFETITGLFETHWGSLKLYAISRYASTSNFVRRLYNEQSKGILKYFDVNSIDQSVCDRLYKEGVNVKTTEDVIKFFRQFGVEPIGD